MSIECVSHYFQNVCIFSGIVVMDFDLSLPVEDKFFWSDGKWNFQLEIGSSSDYMIILMMRRRSWRELDSWSFGSGRLSSVQCIF